MSRTCRWYGAPVRRLRSGLGGFDLEARKERFGRRERARDRGVRCPREFLEKCGPAVPVRFVRVGVAKLREQPRRGARQERRGGQSQQPTGLNEVTEGIA